MVTNRTVNFDEVKLVWRPKPHTDRLVVGSISRDFSGYCFSYGGDILAAKALGFTGYPGLQDLSTRYSEQAISTFASRLPGRERPDFAELISAWDGAPSMTDFELLGLTGGRLPTDLFEFIPVIIPRDGTSFVTSLAGIQNYAESEAFRTLPIGTKLDLEPNPLNTVDPHAVRVLHDGKQVAHLKRVISDSVFEAIQNGLQVTCLLERRNVNGVIREVVVRVTF